MRQRERHARLSGTLADDEDERSDIYGDDAQRQGLAPRRTSHCWIVPDGPQCDTFQCALLTSRAPTRRRGHPLMELHFELVDVASESHKYPYLLYQLHHTTFPLDYTLDLDPV